MKTIVPTRRKVETAMMAFLKSFICLGINLKASIIRVATSPRGRVKTTKKDVQNNTSHLLLSYIPSVNNYTNTTDYRLPTTDCLNFFHFFLTKNETFLLILRIYIVVVTAKMAPKMEAFPQILDISN